MGRPRAHGMPAMTTVALDHTVSGPNEAGDYLITYPTPGAPHVPTLAGFATTEALAQAECARLNEEQVIERRAAMVRKANMIVLDQEG